MATKNLGQVAGVAIQNTPPTNIALIWYDSTPSQMCHKVYDTAKKQWVIIDQKIISTITYSELENIARQSGLPLGKFYQIIDRNNTLAMAIASTKVQYTDSLGNILIDDLGTNIQYHVSSSNLQIDGVGGSYNSTNSKLIFIFDELENDIENDYILGKTKRNNVWQLFKFKLKSLISSETGNAISWNKGLFLNIQSIISNLKDKVGGFVSFETFSKTVSEQNQSISNVGKENQNIIQNAQTAIVKATSADAIYGSKLPSIATGGEPTDVAKGDTLLNIVSKIQRYINRFKYATGIKISKDFSEQSGKVNNNDTVESAIAKLQGQYSGINLNLPDDWVVQDIIDEHNQNILAGDDYNLAFAKIEIDRRTRNDLETSSTPIDIVTNLTDNDTETVKYRIVNGMLEIVLEEAIVLRWGFSNTASVADHTRFFKINFPQEIIDRIVPYIPFGIMQNYSVYNAYRIMPILPISIGRLQSVEDDTWIATTVNYDIRALVSFGYHSKSTQEDNAFGLVLSPLAKLEVKNGELQVNGDIVSTPFNSLFDKEKHKGVLYVIPPMVIRYKIF